MDIRLNLACGTDIPIPQCQLTLHQPTIKEISYIGEQNFFLGVQCLNVNKNMINQGETLLKNINNFQIFMTIMTEKETVDKREAVVSLFQIIFPEYKATVLPKTIIFSKDGITSTIDENNFEDLQEVLKQVFCLNASIAGQSSFNPADERARQIAEKLMRGRQRVAAQSGNTQSSIFSQYLSVLTVGISSMSLTDCMNLTMYQMFDLIERYALYTDWDIDIRSRLAGAKQDSQPDNWMKNIH